MRSAEVTIAQNSSRKENLVASTLFVRIFILRVWMKSRLLRLEGFFFSREMVRGFRGVRGYK